MSDKSSQVLTLLLQQASQGDKTAAEKLMDVVYPELRRIAASRMRTERADHTLQPTAVVNELYLRLFSAASLSWQNRAHFFAVAAKQIRFILIDHARRKPEAELFALRLDAEEGPEPWQLPVQTNAELLALEEALVKLEAVDPRAAQGVELRFFSGLTLQEVAEVQGKDPATVKRDWTFARSFLYKQLYPVD